MQKQQGPRPRRLLVVSQHFWPENFRINDIVEGFGQMGIEVDVLCGLPNYPKGEWFPGYRYTGPRRQVHAGAQVVRAGEIRRKGNTSLRILLNYCFFPVAALFSLPRLAGSYDAVLCYETSPVLMVLPAIVYAKAKKLPLTTYVLDLWPDNLYSVLPVQSPFWRRVAQGVSDWHYRRSDVLAALSEGAAARLKERTAGAKKPPKVVVVPQYSEDFYARDVRDEELRRRYAGRFNILFAGNISPAQDLENLVRALARAKAQPGGEKARVLILGDGMSREALEAFVQAQGLGQDVLFCGSVPPEEVPRWTGMADALFCGLAKSENLGLTVPGKIPTYFAAGRPMLVATGGEGAAVAEKSGAALASGAGDDAALAENILALCRAPAEKLAQMGRAGRAYYQTHYRRDVLLQKLADVVFAGQGRAPGA